MNSKTRSTSQRALKSVSSKPGKVDFIKKNKEQVSKLAKRNRSNSSSRSRKISPKDSSEDIQSHPHPHTKITNLKEARDRVKLQRISEAESATMSQEYDDFKRSKDRVSYSQPLEIPHFEDVSTEEEGKQDREHTENRESRKEQQKLDTVQEENTRNEEKEEENTKEIQKEEENTKEIEKEVEKNEEDLFLQTFGGSQGRESSSGKSQSIAMQAVQISYTQRHLTDYHVLSPKPILRSVKKEEAIKAPASTAQEKQVSITHFIPEHKPQPENETFYDAVDEAFNPTEPQNPSRLSSELDMVLEVPLEISHANIIHSQHSNHPTNPLASHQTEESPLDMELEYPEPIQIPTPQKFYQSQPESKPVFPSHSTPEASYSQISVPASRKKSISFDVPEPQMHSTPAHTPSYVHKATPFPRSLPHEMNHSLSQPYGHETSSEAYLNYSQQTGVASAERKGGNLASLYDIPETLNHQEKEDAVPTTEVSIPIPAPTTHETESLHRTPEPTSLIKTSELSSAHQAHESSSLHNSSEVSIQQTHEPISLHKSLEPSSIHQTHEPASIHHTPEPLNMHKTPEPTNMHKTPETNKENMDPAFRNIKYDKMPMSEQIKRSARRVRITDTGEEIPDVTWTELKLKLSGAQPSEHAEMENIQISEFRINDISHQENANIQSHRESISQPPDEIQLHFTPEKTTISIQTSPVHSNKVTPLRRSARLAARRKNVFEYSQPQESPKVDESPESAESPESTNSQESEKPHEPAESPNMSSSEKEALSPNLKRKLKPSNFSEFDVPVETYEEYYGIGTSSRKKLKYK